MSKHPTAPRYFPSFDIYLRHPNGAFIIETREDGGEGHTQYVSRSQIHLLLDQWLDKNNYPHGEAVKGAEYFNVESE